MKTVNLAFVLAAFALAGLPPAHSQTIIADSRNEFGGQGQDNWYYGYYPSTNLTPSGFTLFEYRNTGGLAILVGWSHGRDQHPPSLGYAFGEPVGSSTAWGEQWVVRRWTSEISGLITISGEFRKTPGNTVGDGVVGEILVDGVPIYSQFLAGSDTTGFKYSAQANVQVGSLVDFVLRPYQTVGNSDGDSSVFTAIISDSLPALSIADIVAPEPTNGTLKAAFVVRLLAPSTQTVAVVYATTDGTATAGADYEAVSGTLTFAPGETNKTIEVTILSDTLIEGNENFVMSLTNAANATIVKAQGTSTINELRITSLEFNVNISFTTANQARYRVEWTEDSMTWSGVPGAADVVGTGNIVTVTDSNTACRTNRTYRVVLLQ